MTSYWLIPWSVGFECRTVKPQGHSIEVVEREEFDKLLDRVKELNARNEELQNHIYDLTDRND